jgi:hypothetical protein
MTTGQAIRQTDREDTPTPLLPSPERGRPALHLLPGHSTVQPCGPILDLKNQSTSPPHLHRQDPHTCRFPSFSQALCAAGASPRMSPLPWAVPPYHRPMVNCVTALITPCNFLISFFFIYSLVLN